MQLCLKLVANRLCFQGNGDGRGTYEEETITRAKHILKPFFLRRLKSEVCHVLSF